MRAVLFASLLVACGGKSSTTTATTTPAPAAAEPAKTLPDVAFDQLDHDQRVQFMKEKVVPAMKPVFQNHDPKGYAEFGCQTCHGKDAAQGHYDMPNADLPGIGKATDWSKYKQEDLDWMRHEVKPAMAKILQQPERGPDHPDGFGCMECHPAAD